MKNFSYKTVLKYAFALCLFAAADNVVKGVPISLSVFAALVATVYSPVYTAIVYLAFVFVTFPPENAMLLAAAVVFLCIIFLLYKLKKRKIGAETMVFVLIAIAAYLLGPFVGEFNVKLVYSAIIAILAYIQTQCYHAVFVKKTSVKKTLGEKIAAGITVIFFSLGAIELLGFKVWECVALTVTLFCCGFFKSAKALIPAFVLPVALALYAQDISVLAVFEIYCGAALIFINRSKLLSALSLVAAEGAYLFLSGGFYTFKTLDYILYFIPVVVYLFIPGKLYVTLGKHFKRFDEPEITREIINLERTELSSRLYGIADSFKALENALSLFECKQLPEDEAAGKIADDVEKKVCENCSNTASCRYSGEYRNDDLVKLAKVGISKGKVNLIDLSRNFSSHCYCINDVLSEINRLLNLYFEKNAETKIAENGKELLTMQAYGISEALKDMAFAFSEKIRFGKKEESLLFDNLCLSGIVPRKIVYAGNEYHMLFGKEKVVWSKVADCISDLTGIPYKLLRKTDVGGGILAVFSKSPAFDATFGYAKRTKDGSDKSGDGFTLTKINEGKFLVAVSDGMGSGERACLTSSSTLSLIESFYAAGLKNDIILKIANSLLSTCFKDGFSTLDSAIIDLYAGKCDIIKVGASFGFLLKKDSVKIIENESLPLGILEYAKPTCSSFKLSDEDVLVIMSDGVTDAFFSSTDAMEYFNEEKSSNPQAFAEKILNHALELGGGKANDDMTVLVVKIYDTPVRKEF